MKYWKVFVHPYTFGKQDMPATSSQVGARKDSESFIVLAYFSVAIFALSLWVIKSVVRLDTPTLPSIGD